MQLLGLDKDFQPVGYLQYFNLQWTREYYDIGQFSVKVDPASYSPDMAYVYTPERPEAGIIQKVEMQETVKGRAVQISGYFLEALLNDKVVWPTYYATGDIPAAVTAMLQQYKDDIPLLEVADWPAAAAVDGTAWQETGGKLADVAYTRLQTVQMSLRCRYDYLANKITAEVWQGLDRTQSQDVKPLCDILGRLPKFGGGKGQSGQQQLPQLCHHCRAGPSGKPQGGVCRPFGRRVQAHLICGRPQ